MKSKFLIPRDELEDLLFEKKWKLQQIADHFGCHVRTLQGHMRAFGFRKQVAKYEHLDDAKMASLYESGLTCYEIGDMVGCNRETVRAHIKPLVKLRKHKRRKGLFLRENHCAWKGGRIERGGYWAVRVGEEYAMEHRLVMEEIIGRPLTEEEVVHHINRKRKDNDPPNLLLLESNSEHQRLHAAMRLHPGLDQRAWVAQYRIENAALAA